MSRPLSHIRVLDLSRILAGPWCAQNLADLGAEVIKIERPGPGDDTRSWGPPFLKDAQGNDTREAAYYLSVNRGKKSVAVDIATPGGQALIRELATKCDVVLENFKVGDLARYGLAYDDLRKVNPSIVYCSLTGFGQTGPSAARPGYDFIFQGMGGLMSLTGEPDGMPQKVGIAVTDVLTGMYASLAITAALNYRQLTGTGQHIDLALYDSIVAFNANQIFNYWHSGNLPKRYGNAHANVVPYEVFAVADGHIILAVGNDTQFADFSGVMGHPEWSADERYKTNPARLRNRDTLLPMIRDVLLTRTKSDWLAALEAASVPGGPINNMREVFEDEHVVARGVKVAMTHPLGVPMSTVANPMRFSETPITYETAPPMLGQHTDEVLRGVLGMSGEAIDLLRAQKIVT
jgi:formyl-CoA transferase